MKLFKKAKFLKYPRFEFKSSFQNVGRIWVWFQKQLDICRAFDFEQLLFLEIFELLHKFGSNLGFKTTGNSVILVNSARGRHLIAGELLFHSGRRRGHPWHRAGIGKAPLWLPLASWPAFIARASPPFFFSLPLFSRRHRRCSVELA